MTDETEIRLRADGSIDIEHYLAKGRDHRSKAAHQMARNVAPRAGRVLVVMAALGVFIPFLGGNG